MASIFPQIHEHRQIFVKTCNQQTIGLVLFVLLANEHGLIVFVSAKMEADLVPNFYLLAIKDKLDDVDLLIYYCDVKGVNESHLLNDLEVILKIGDFDETATEKCDLVLLAELYEILQLTLRGRLAELLFYFFNVFQEAVFV